MLYRLFEGNFIIWRGEAIDGIKHPFGIENSWSDGELAAIGLYRPPADLEPPEGKRIVSRRLEMVDGTLVWVNELDDELPLTVSQEAVYDERDRRLAQGFDFDFGDERGVHRISTSKSDMEGWDEVSKFAQALINAGQGDDLITIATGSGITQVSAVEWQAVLIAAAQFRQPIWGASFLIASMSPIPADYNADHHWDGTASSTAGS